MLCWSLPPGIWLSGCHLVWRVVASWLLSSLMATKLRPCVRLCPLHHVGGGIRWVSQKPLRTPLKLHAPAFLACCCLLSCLVLLTFPLLIGLAFSLLILMLGPSYSATSAKPEGKKCWSRQFSVILSQAAPGLSIAPLILHTSTIHCEWFPRSWPERNPNSGPKVLP